MAAEGGSSRPAGGGARWRVALSLAIGLGFVALVEWYVGWSGLLAVWRELPPGPLAGATLLMLASHVARGLRVHDYFGQAVAGERSACLRLVLQHNLMNNLLPMRSGELAFPVLMARRFGVPAQHSVPGLLWFRLLDLHALVLLAAPVLALALPLPLLVPALALWLLVPWTAWRGMQRSAGAWRAPSGRLAHLLVRVHAGLPQSARVFWRAQGWTLLTWGVKLSALVGLLQALAPLSLAWAVPGALGGELTSVLPIHGVAGFGSYEAGVVAAALPSGVDPATLLGAAVNLHLFILGVTLIAGGLAFVPGRARAGGPGDGGTS